MVRSSLILSLIFLSLGLSSQEIDLPIKKDLLVQKHGGYVYVVGESTEQKNVAKIYKLDADLNVVAEDEFVSEKWMFGFQMFFDDEEIKLYIRSRVNFLLVYDYDLKMRVGYPRSDNVNFSFVYDGYRWNSYPDRHQSIPIKSVNAGIPLIDNEYTTKSFGMDYSFHNNNLLFVHATNENYGFRVGSLYSSSDRAFKGNVEVFGYSMDSSGQFDSLPKFRIPLVNDYEIGRVDFKYSGLGDDVYLTVTGFADKAPHSTNGHLVKLNAETGEILFNVQFPFHGASIITSKMFFVDSSIVVCGMLGHEHYRNKFFLTEYSSKTGKLKGFHISLVNEWSEELNVKGVSHLAKGDIFLTEVKRVNGKLYALAEIGYMFLPSNPNGVNTLHFKRVTSFAFTAFDQSLKKMEILDRYELDRTERKRYTCLVGCFRDAYSNFLNNDASVLLFDESDNKDTFKGHFTALGLRGGKIYMKELYDKDFIKKYKVKTEYYLLKDMNTLYQIGSSKKHTVIRIRKI